MKSESWKSESCPSTVNRPGRTSVPALALALALGLGVPAIAAPLADFSFDEGSGTMTTDAVAGFIGELGFVQDPSTNTPMMVADSASGEAGDGSVSVVGEGFLVVDDSDGPVLAFGPGEAITVEAWINIDPNFGGANEGIVNYGHAYKLGLRSGELVWTLYGVVDVASGLIPLAGEWTHVAAVYEPGVGVTFYLDGETSFVEETRDVPPYLNHYLVIGAERFGNNIVAMFDRVRIHGAALTAEEIDDDPANPQPLLAGTAVAYNFDEASLPADNAGTPSRPTMNSADILPMLSGPVWTSDTPAGQEGDFALAFNMDGSPIRQRVTVDLTGNPLNLGANNTNYTLEAWVKLPTTLINERMVIYRSAGPAPRVSFSVNANRTLHTTVFGTQDIGSSVRIPNDNRWHHIAAVMEDFARIHFYLDGVLSQTVNVTGTGAPTGTSAENLLIGMESDTRYFKGLLDRVRIHNTALSAAELDYPAVPGLPRVLANPGDALVNIGEEVTFEAEVESASAATYQWRYRASRADSEGVDVPGADSTTLTLSGVTPENQGFYSVVTANETGETESYAARLTVRTAPGTLQPLWTILPGERDYVNPPGDSAQTQNLERGMAYNAMTDHLLIGSRIDSPTIRGIYIVDAETGAHVGELPGTGIITGGTIVLTRVGVAEDGAIYACNFGTLSDANPLKIYRWADETSEPTVAYEGNPASEAGLSNQQWGKNMTVRGSGVDTRILLDTRTTWLGLFTTTDGVEFTSAMIQAEARNDDWNLGLVWGAGETFWGRNSFEPLFQWQLDAEEQSAAQLRAYPDFPGEFFSNFSFSEDGTLLGGMSMDSNPDVVELYDVSDLERGPVLVDTAAFTADSGSVTYGNVYVAGGRMFALSPNNGIIALGIDAPAPAPSLAVNGDGEGNLVITWPASFEGYVLEWTETLPATTWTEETHEVVGDENTAIVEPLGTARYFRLRN